MERLTDAQRALVENNMKLVYFIVNRMGVRVPSEHYQDIIQEGFVGLCRAAQTFKPSKHFLFATYASICIRNAVLMDYRKIKRRTSNIEVSLDEITRYDGNGTPHERHEFVPAVEDVVTANGYTELREVLASGGGLTPLERQALQMHISGARQIEIGEAMEISQSYVSRLLKNARKKVSEYLSDDSEQYAS